MKNEFIELRDEFEKKLQREEVTTISVILGRIGCSLLKF
jgi:hypothetical protein